ncbi:hypothetical protein HRR83_006582 [Exophiala dermatitidis]|uniref:Major facilitator superfamily transporter n=2 Tax=Exophiala dermatitidis TaxID=5970 RepID=H6BWC0_EXODN|nr:uncharacterized protein HMPREF1120_04142 [Exophiala dermatitidis NIH/UT8656]KAJ4511338.1 hypothetical protein HRR75_005263 [Exophiala dermatitidis]EHY56036.1 hypothetical protein HMPREF1120_04142 [Exophiala dermatitidis NIH/UT8656]KAJ4514084.1 hypothetical protein HRR74_005742 [Exophiala dermatitidis]KAJ4515433.1 hypothetical protein HRR73_005265 [Exophiala dermatitidis]KAJ4533733.1 hypothetical protein HRR77_008217 [Exophiala dermatitidis]
MGWQRRASTGIGADNSMGRIRSRGQSDIEKEAFVRTRLSEDDHSYETYNDEDPSVASSRNTSSSYKPMLINNAYTSKRSSSPSYLGRMPRSIMRWLCLGVAATLLIFVFSLVQLSWNADKEVKVAIEQQKITPKPPPWESFPFLKRYYGGIRALVPAASNIPEYPANDDELPNDSFNIADEVKDEEEAKREEERQENQENTKAKRAVPASIKFNPYPNYTSPEYVAKYGQKVDCFLDTKNTISIPSVRVYEGIPRGFPDAVMGSAELLGLRSDICYDRFGRLGPYGLGYSINRGGSGAKQEGEREGADLVWEEVPEVDWRKVQWADAQQRCVAANQHRFKELPESRPERLRSMQIGAKAKRDEHLEFAKSSGSTEPSEFEEPSELAAPSEFASVAEEKAASPKNGTEKLPRTAVVIRTWSDYPYTIEDVMYIRSIISELTMLTGGEYVVHFLIQVKSDDIPIWADDETYDRVLRDSLPEEFHGMGTLWSERQMLLMYGGLEETWMRDLPVHGVYRSTFMPMQYFAHRHPEYDFFWNWEMDIRSTHHWYHLFDSVSRWAKAQPRKLLWERNGRFYVPSEHGSWEDFSQMVRIQTEHGTNSANNLWSSLNRAAAEHEGSQQGQGQDSGGGGGGGSGSGSGRGSPVAVGGGMKQQGDKPIWGPERPLDDPNVAFEDDPKPPTSFDKDKYVWGVGEEADLIVFNPLFDPEGTTWLLRDDTTGYNITRGRPPRRTAIITASRLSKRLLSVMHRETAFNKHTMFSEMWPASCALHHGLKAVYAPHPEYIDRKWPTNYLQAVFNGGRNGATGGARTSVFGDREHNFRGTTWYYNAGFPEVLWHRWLGMKIHNDGGEQDELAGEGRMCLPGMLLHPVKKVDLVQEGRRDD